MNRLDEARPADLPVPPALESKKPDTRLMRPASAVPLSVETDSTAKPNRDVKARLTKLEASAIRRPRIYFGWRQAQKWEAARTRGLKKLANVEGTPESSETPNPDKPHPAARVSEDDNSGTEQA